MGKDTKKTEYIIEEKKIILTAAPNNIYNIEAGGGKTEEYKIWENTQNELSESVDRFYEAASESFCRLMLTSSFNDNNTFSTTSFYPSSCTQVYFSPFNKTIIQNVVFNFSGSANANVKWNLRFGSSSAYNAGTLICTASTTSSHTASGHYITGSAILTGSVQSGTYINFNCDVISGFVMHGFLNMSGVQYWQGGVPE